MIDPCCGMMASYGRDRYAGAPESDLSDALIEVDRQDHRVMLLLAERQSMIRIHFCPWCGAALDKDPA